MPLTPPLIRPSGTFSLEGEGFASLFETVDSATPGKPFVQNDRDGRHTAQSESLRPGETEH